MKLTKEQVKHVARLANLPLSEQEEELYSDQLSNILGYIEQLSTVDTENVTPTFNTSGNKNATQDDLTRESLNQEDAVKNASASRDGYFVTKGVFESE